MGGKGEREKDQSISIEEFKDIFAFCIEFSTMCSFGIEILKESFLF